MKTSKTRQIFTVFILGYLVTLAIFTALSPLNIWTIPSITEITVNHFSNAWHVSISNELLQLPSGIYYLLLSVSYGIFFYLPAFALSLFWFNKFLGTLHLIAYNLRFSIAEYFLSSVPKFIIFCVLAIVLYNTPLVLIAILFLLIIDIKKASKYKHYMASLYSHSKKICISLLNEYQLSKLDFQPNSIIEKAKYKWMSVCYIAIMYISMILVLASALTCMLVYFFVGLSYIVNFILGFFL